MFKVTGMAELQKSMKKLGYIPQKYITTAAKKGMNPILSDAKASAPVDTGKLRKGIILSGERTKTKGKKVYRIIFDSKMNDIFQKRDKTGRIVGYYPVSMEYGYFSKSGRYIPGYKFIHKDFQKGAQSSAQIMVDTLKTKIDAEISKLGLK
jgi:hypothetical protein